MKSKNTFWRKSLAAAIAVAISVSFVALAAEDAAVERTKKQLMMLDDLYKTLVVLITEHYVKDATTVPVAATASKALFKAMKEKGWHEARLLGYTDVLFNPAENTPKEGFETKAKGKILAGEASYSEVIEEGGKRYVQMSTAVPVVMEKCVMCHANFKGKTGAIGALSYKMAVIE
ncbi:MAG: c-type heme family protein [Gammaproteobacteria bacterium]